MSEVLAVLNEKLDFYKAQEAITADPEQKFSLKKKIEGVKADIQQVKNGNDIGISSQFEASLESTMLALLLQRRDDADKTDEALRAINEALIETSQYIEEFGGDKCADRGTEYRLAKLWADASVKARHASPELARRFNDKSLYWRATVDWSREEVLAKRIDFASIEATLAELLTQET